MNPPTTIALPVTGLPAAECGSRRRFYLSKSDAASRVRHNAAAECFL